MCIITPGTVGCERQQKRADHLPKDDFGSFATRHHSVIDRFYVPTPAPLTAVDRGVTGATRFTASIRSECLPTWRTPAINLA